MFIDESKKLFYVILESTQNSVFYNYTKEGSALSVLDVVPLDSRCRREGELLNYASSSFTYDKKSAQCIAPRLRMVTTEDVGQVLMCNEATRVCFVLDESAGLTRSKEALHEWFNQDPDLRKRVSFINQLEFESVLISNGWVADNYVECFGEAENTRMSGYEIPGALFGSLAVIIGGDLTQLFPSPDMRNPEAFSVLHTIMAGALLFAFRCRFRALYGAAEMLLGVVLLALFMHHDELKGSMLYTFAQMTAMQLIVVRGLDNVSQGGMSKYTFWRQVFP